MAVDVLLWVGVLFVSVSSRMAALHLVNQLAPNAVQNNGYRAISHALVSSSHSGREDDSGSPHHIILPQYLTRVNPGEEIVFEVSATVTLKGMVASVTDTSGEFYLAYTGSTISASVALAEQGMKYEIRLLDSLRSEYTVQAIPRSIYDRDPPPEEEGLDESDERSLAASLRRTEALLTHTGHTGHIGSIGSGSHQSLAAASDTNGIIDVMFIFTPQALASVGGTQSAMQALVTMALQMANDAYRNTNSPLRMRAVRVAASVDTTYVEKGFSDELTRLRFSNDGYFDADMAYRTAVGADAVVLFVATNTYCGLGYQTASSADMALAVVCTQCPDSVVHEVGHNIGLNHDRVTAQDYDKDKYNFGYCWDTSATTCRRSVMAYSGCVTTNRRTNCPRGLYFSSPLLVQGDLGRTTGLTTADNARVLREQWSRAINWMPSKTKGGLIFSVEPAYAVLGRCEAITITGWRLGTTGSDIVSVTMNGVPVLRILWQTLDSVQVLAGLGPTSGLGDVVVSTASGYATTLPLSFAYEPTAVNTTTDFENGGLGAVWASAGSLDWRVLRYCDALPCANSPSSGPAVGYGGTGSFARAMAVDDTPVEAVLLARFNTHGNGCTEEVRGVSLYYHMWGAHMDECGGSLSVEYQNTALQWRTVLTATTGQQHQDDPWLPLSYRFADPASVVALRLVAHPYTGPASCFQWGSLSVDHIVIDKQTTCPDDNCGFISAHPTYSVTQAPTFAPSTHRPTTFRPTTAPPTTIPTAAPTFPRVPGVELVQFGCQQSLRGLSATQFLAEAQHSRALLRTAAEGLGTPPDTLCCLEVADGPAADAPQSGDDGSEPLTGYRALAESSIAVSYQVTLQVPILVAPNGEVESDGSLSPTALEAFNSSVHRLVDSVSTGQFGSSLVAASAGLSAVQVDPVALDSFTAPTSFVYRLSSAPTMAPTVRPQPSSPEEGFFFAAGASAYVVVAVILVAALGMGYGAWKAYTYVDKKKPARRALELTAVERGGGRSTSVDGDSCAEGDYARHLGVDDDGSTPAELSASEYGEGEGGAEGEGSSVGDEESHVGPQSFARPVPITVPPYPMHSAPRNMPLAAPLYGAPTAGFLMTSQGGFYVGGHAAGQLSVPYVDTSLLQSQLGGYHYAALAGSSDSRSTGPSAGGSPRNFLLPGSAGVSGPDSGWTTPRYMQPLSLGGSGPGSTDTTPRHRLPGSSGGSGPHSVASTPRHLVPQHTRSRSVELVPGHTASRSRSIGGRGSIDSYGGMVPERGLYPEDSTASWFQPAPSSASSDDGPNAADPAPVVRREDSNLVPAAALQRTQSGNLVSVPREASLPPVQYHRRVGSDGNMPSNFVRPPPLRMDTLSSWSDRDRDRDPVRANTASGSGSGRANLTRSSSVEGISLSGRPPLRTPRASPSNSGGGGAVPVLRPVRIEPGSPSPQSRVESAEVRIAVRTGTAAGGSTPQSARLRPPVGVTDGRDRNLPGSPRALPVPIQVSSVAADSTNLSSPRRAPPIRTNSGGGTVQQAVISIETALQRQGSSPTVREGSGKHRPGSGRNGQAVA